MPDPSPFRRGDISHGAVIVTDGHERSALAVVRSLGARGIPVYVGSDRTSSVAGSSRYCAGTFVYPSPWTHPHQYLVCLVEAAKHRQAGLIYPMTDVAVEILGGYQEQGGRDITLPIPSLDAYQALSDKYRLMQWAERAGVPIPKTLFLESRDSLASVIDQIAEWPVVVKPGRSLIRDGTLWKKTSVAMAADRESLMRLYRERWYLKWPSMIQQQVAGFGEGVFGLFAKGKPEVLFAHRRLREKPPSGGVSVLRESIALPEEMTRYAVQVMQSVTWQGVAMVEFKVNQETRVPYLMEVNGRFWGSLQLAIDAGIDFPWLLYQLATSGQVPVAKPSYKVGVRSSWWLGDLDHFLIRVRQSDSALHLPPGTPSRWETLKSLVGVCDRNTKSEVLRADDPRPGFCELRAYIRSLIAVPWRRFGERLAPVRLAGKKVWWDATLRLGLMGRAERISRGRSIKHILLLCKGNICRSPFAAEYLRGKMKEAGLAVEVASAGLDTNAGDPADPQAQRSASEFGVSLAGHRTAVLSGEMVAKADLLIVMELMHQDMLLNAFPEAREKTRVLGHYSQEPMTNIADPFGQTPDVFHVCYRQLVQSCDGLIRWLSTSV